MAVDPAGPAVVGQTVFAESGPQLLHLKLQMRYLDIDAPTRQLGIHCGFGSPAGWRGALARCLMHRRINAAPLDSLMRHAAEPLHARVASAAAADI
jgi:hypothetical protein